VFLEEHEEELIKRVKEGVNQAKLRQQFCSAVCDHRDAVYRQKEL
jgi:hypothetical protein